MLINTSYNTVISKNIKSGLTGHFGIDGKNDWIKYIVPEKYYQQFASRSDYKYLYEFNNKIRDIKKNINIDSKIKEIYKSYDSDITHAGLIYYLNYCWTQELGASLRPDILFYTIVSEIAREIVNNPNKYGYLMSNSKDKIDLVTKTNQDYEINIDLVDKLLDTNILDKEFKKIITETHFDSQPDNFDLALKITFAYSASPYFNYLTSKCGIPHMEVLGSREEYEMLLSKINKLKLHVPNLSEYLTQCSNIINDILYWCFGSNLRPILTECLNKEMFMSAIFYINKRCGSGHPYDVLGWINKLYIKKHNQLYDYPAHINYIPYKFIDGDKYYYKAIGLCYSELDNDKNILRPKYGYTVHEVLDHNLFDFIKN